MTGPTHHEIRELLGAFALDAVDPDEAQLVESHLRDCRACAEEVAGHREVASALAHSYDAPPDGLWSRIRNEIDAGPTEDPPVLPIELRRAMGRPAQAADVPSEGSSSGRRSEPGRRWPVLAAAAALVVAVLGGLVWQQQNRIDELENVAAPSITDLAEQAASQPGARTVELTGDGAIVEIVVGPDDIAYLRGDSLPALGPDRTYQLWGVTGDQVVSLGVLGSDPGVSAFALPAGTETLAVTDETAGGVVASSQDPVVVGAVAG